jgi:sugar O-acyltransferase (sialic acid O-acetyltransferase NeuD family)
VTNRKKLYLIGAGNFGREMESWLELLPGFYEEWEIKGYLDQNPNALNGFPSDYKVVGSPLEYPFQRADYILLCLTKSSAKKNISQALKGKVNFFTYVAPSVTIGKYTTIGEGSIIAPNSVVTTNVRIDQFVTINCGTQIGHDCVVGKFSSLMANVDLGGGVRLGENVFMGTNSTIIPQRSIADNIIIGAGSIVFKNLSRPGTYLGNPATLLRF